MWGKLVPVGDCSKAKDGMSCGMRYERCGGIGGSGDRHGGELERRGGPGYPCGG